MDSRDSLCPQSGASEPTTKGTGLEYSAGKEDPVELDSTLNSRRDVGDVEQGGACAIVKYPHSYRHFPHALDTSLTMW